MEYINFNVKELSACTGTEHHQNSIIHRSPLHLSHQNSYYNLYRVLSLYSYIGLRDSNSITQTLLLFIRMHTYIHAGLIHTKQLHIHTWTNSARHKYTETSLNYPMNWHAITDWPYLQSDGLLPFLCSSLQVQVQACVALPVQVPPTLSQRFILYNYKESIQFLDDSQTLQHPTVLIRLTSKTDYLLGCPSIIRAVTIFPFSD